VYLLGTSFAVKVLYTPARVISWKSQQNHQILIIDGPSGCVKQYFYLFCTPSDGGSDPILPASLARATYAMKYFSELRLMKWFPFPGGSKDPKVTCSSLLVESWGTL
jgi:hypothetical protein